MKPQGIKGQETCTNIDGMGLVQSMKKKKKQTKKKKTNKKKTEPLATLQTDL